MTWEITLAGVGVLLNLLATVVGFVRLSMKFEHRMTRVETLLEWFLPKPRRGGEGVEHERG